MHTQTLYEEILPRRSLRQPLPHVVPGGDCGACVLAGIFQRDLGYAYGTLNNSITGAIAHPEMAACIERARWEGIADRTVTAVPQWPVPSILQAWGNPSWQQSHEWFYYLRMAIDAGYYGVASIDFHHSGPFGTGPDHWVLLCGVRERRVGFVIEHEVLVSCCVSHTERWVSAYEFLRHWGGFNVLLVRPTT